MVLRAFCRKSCKVRPNYWIVNRELRACDYDPVCLVDVAWTADPGERYVTLTAYNGNVAVNAFVNVNVTRTTVPFIFRTSAPYISVGFAFSIGLGSVGIFLIRPLMNRGKDQNKEDVGMETRRAQSR